MIIIWGEQLYGRCDKVPGLFSVATKFFHLWYIPLIPFQSWVIIDGTESSDGFRGVQIGLSLKSILIGWMRAAAVLGIIGAVIWGLITGGQFQQLPLFEGPVGAGGLAVSCIFLYWVTTLLGKANLARALTLGEKIGLDPDVIYEFYGAEGSDKAVAEEDERRSKADEDERFVAEEA